MADVSAILSKLYSGSPLSAQEKFDIGIGPTSRQAELDAIAAQNAAANQKSIADLQALGVGGATAPTSISSGAYLNPTPTTRQPVTRAGELAAANAAAKKAGPPYEAPAGTHWNLIGSEWKLYKDFVDNRVPTGSTFPQNSNANANTNVVPQITDKKEVSQSAKDYISKFLNDAGLGNLAGQVWTQWTSGQSEDQIIDWIRSTPEYASRFPAMATLRKDGRSISEAQYVAKEQADIDLMKQYGIPDPIATDKKLLGNLIANNVSQVTLQKRLIAGQDTVLGFDNQIRQYAKDTYGLGDGALLAWVLNPDIALPVLEQQAQAMRIGGAALTSGYDRGLGAQGELGKTQAEALAAQGISQQQAQQGFTQLAQMGQLEQQLPGDVSGQLTSQEMIDAIFGISGEAQQKLGKVKQTRVGEFQQGGNFAAAQSGIVGIGQAPQV